MQVIDKRVIERQIRKGKLDAAAYQRSLMGLPDVSDRVARESDLEPIRREVSPVVVSPAVSSEPRAAAAPSEADATDDVDDDDDIDDEEEDDDDDADDEAEEPSDTPAP